MNLFTSTITGLGALFTAALVAGCASSGPRVPEEQKFIQLHHVANTGEEVNLKKGDAVAMVCTKCKTVLYANIQKPYNRFVTPFEHRHFCWPKNAVPETARPFRSIIWRFCGPQGIARSCAPP